ncbi:hypothetical protein D3C76_802830 [compost metagenome]
MSALSPARCPVLATGAAAGGVRTKLWLPRMICRLAGAMVWAVEALEAVPGSLTTGARWEAVPLSASCISAESFCNDCGLNAQPPRATAVARHNKGLRKREISGKQWVMVSVRLEE